MGTMSVQSRALCLTLRGCKWGYLDFDRKRLETTAQWVSFCFFCDVHFWCPV